LREESLPVKLLFVFREDYLGKIKELLAAYPNLIDWSLRLPSPKTDELQRKYADRSNSIPAITSLRSPQPGSTNCASR